MERRPLGLSDAEYEARRAGIFELLSPKQKGMYELLEGFFAVHSQRNQSIRWGGRVRPDVRSFLEPTLKGKVASLPIPGEFGRRPDGYERFNWKVYNDAGETLVHLGIQMRVDDSAISLTEVVGESTFSQVETDLRRILDNSSFPAVATDTKGFRYENPAFAELKKSQAA